MNEAIIILMNMRGGCATVGDTVHALFRFNGRVRKAEPNAAIAAANDAGPRDQEINSEKSVTAG